LVQPTEDHDASEQESFLTTVHVGSHCHCLPYINA